MTIENVNNNFLLTDSDESLFHYSNFNLRMMGGSDSIEVTGGLENFANGNIGDDKFIVRSGQGNYFGGKGSDSFNVCAGFDNYFNGQLGDDSIILYGGFGTFLGGDGNDTIEVVGASAVSSVNGNFGADIITGSVSGVIYREGKDNDLLAVSQGDVWGDKGADTFRAVAGDGFAVIQDYTIGEDKVEIEMDGSWSNVGDGLMFTDDSGDQLMLLLGIDDAEQATRI